MIQIETTKGGRQTFGRSRLARVARRVGWLSLAALALVGCKKGPGDVPCTYTHKNPGFCFAPPPGFQPGVENKYGDDTMLGFRGPAPTYASIDLHWGGSFENHIAAIKVHPAPSSPSKLVAEGNLENGGYWTHTTSPNNGKLSHYLAYAARGKSGWVRCEVGTADVATFEAIFNACKTLKID